MQLSWDNPMQHSHFKRTVLSIWKMIASHRYVGAKGQIDIILCASSHVTLSSLPQQPPQDGVSLHGFASGCSCNKNSCVLQRLREHCIFISSV